MIGDVPCWTLERDSLASDGDCSMATPVSTQAKLAAARTSLAAEAMRTRDAKAAAAVAKEHAAADRAALYRLGPLSSSRAICPPSNDHQLIGCGDERSVAWAADRDLVSGA